MPPGCAVGPRSANKSTVGPVVHNVKRATSFPATGGGVTVMVTVPVCGWLHAGVPVVETLTSIYVVVAETGAEIEAVPEPSKTIVWFPGAPVTV